MAIARAGQGDSRRGDFSRRPARRGCNERHGLKREKGRVSWGGGGSAEERERAKRVAQAKGERGDARVRGIAWRAQFSFAAARSHRSVALVPPRARTVRLPSRRRALAPSGRPRAAARSPFDLAFRVRPRAPEPSPRTPLQDPLLPPPPFPLPLPSPPHAPRRSLPLSPLPFRKASRALLLSPSSPFVAANARARPLLSPASPRPLSPSSSHPSHLTRPPPPAPLRRVAPLPPAPLSSPAANAVRPAAPRTVALPSRAAPSAGRADRRGGRIHTHTHARRGRVRPDLRADRGRVTQLRVEPIHLPPAPTPPPAPDPLPCPSRPAPGSSALPRGSTRVRAQRRDCARASRWRSRTASMRLAGCRWRRVRRSGSPLPPARRRIAARFRRAASRAALAAASARVPPLLSAA